MKRRDLLGIAAASAVGLILPPWLQAQPGKRIFAIRKPELVALPPVGWDDPVVKAHARAIEIMREAQERALLLGHRRRGPGEGFITRSRSIALPTHLRLQFETEYGIDRRALTGADDEALRRVFGS